MLSWLFSAPLPAGTPAPDFELPDQDGNEFRLSDLRGWNVVLIFYPGDDTPVCRKQLVGYRDCWELVERKDVLVFGVNPQGEVSHSRFRDRYDLPFPLLVDEGQKVGELYKTKGILVRRTVYLVGPDGVIRYSRRGRPNPEEVLATAEVVEDSGPA